MALANTALKQLAIDMAVNKITFFQVDPFFIYEYTDKQSNRGYFFSQRTLTESDSVKVREFVKQYYDLVDEWLK
jgi:hypothetical protein